MTQPQHFGQRWRRAVDEVGDRPFLRFESSTGAVVELTYAEMDCVVARVAAGLHARGVTVGAGVHVVLANSVAFVAMWLACARLGAWMVPSDPRASSAELAEQLVRTEPAVGIASTRRADDYAAAVARAGAPIPAVLVSEDDTDVAALVLPTSGPLPELDTDIDGHRRLAVMFTSGTTSAPKGVELTQANYAFAGDVMAAAAGLTRHDRQFVVLPLFHANAQYYSVAAAISVGASVALMHAFSASQFVEQARRHAVTHASLFAAPIRMILARTPVGTPPLALRHAWFAQNLSTEQYRAISELLGCRPRQIYGMTETVPAVLSNPPVGSRPTAIGAPTLGCEVRIVGPAGDPVAPGETGTIQVGGRPGTTLFRGYLGDPTATASAFVERGADGFVWFDTGDRAVEDGDGFVHFAGRRSDVLKVGGENVSVVEVEAVLAEHPDVTEVAVVGAPDDVMDEVPHAYVVARPGAGGPALLADLDDWCVARLAPSKRPRAVHLVDELPQTSVGKIRKFLLHPVPTTTQGERP
jgi:crotonobetaine/carnitine-CoA ligase